MRIFLFLLVLLPFLAVGQSNIDNEYALELVQRLQDDPLHEQHSTDMQLIFRWLDQSADLMSLMNHPESNKIAKRKRTYQEQMQILYLSGMVRYLIVKAQPVNVSSSPARAEGRTCMCNGYANLREKHRVRRDRFIRRLCKKQ